jgi:hypothetical protein
MGRSSAVRLYTDIDAFFIARPFDTKIITAGVGIPHVDIRYLAILEQPLELGFDDAIGNIPLRDQSPATRIRVESEPVGKHVHRKAPVLPISLAIVLVDEHRAGQRKIFLSVERIVREQYSTFMPDGKGSKALAAGSVTRGHFGMGGMTVAW